MSVAAIVCTAGAGRAIFGRDARRRNSRRDQPPMPSSRQPPRPDVSLADIVTIGNAVCGFLAIAVAARVWTGAPAGEVRMSQHDVVVAAALIIPGGLLDSVDGAVARWRGGSVLGPHLEVMSDAVTFGVAPSVLFAVDAAAYGEPWAAVALVVAAAYAVAVLLRLARYARRPTPRTPACAACLRRRRRWPPCRSSSCTRRRRSRWARWWRSLS